MDLQYHLPTTEVGELSLEYFNPSTSITDALYYTDNTETDSQIRCDLHSADGGNLMEHGLPISLQLLNKARSHF